MAESVHSTAWSPVQVIVAVDPDDPELDAYRGLVRDLFVLGDRVGFSGTLNLIAGAVGATNSILGAFGDDVIFRTPGWDERIRDTLATAGIAYGNDLYFGAGHPTGVFMSRSIARALGWLALPVCRHQYVDDGWKAIGEGLGVLRYRPDVVIEHVHPAYGKGEWDATYREVYDEDQVEADRDAFTAWRTNQLEADLVRARAAL